MTAVDVAVCPTCDTFVSAGATRCECGERLHPAAPVPASASNEFVHGGDCPCLTCYFAVLDGDIRNV